MKKLLSLLLLTVLLLSSCSLFIVPKTTEGPEASLSGDSTEPKTGDTGSKTNETSVSKTAETKTKETATHVDTYEINRGNGGTTDGKHCELYHELSYGFINKFVGEEKWKQYEEIFFYGTSWGCYGHFIEYFQIPREDYEAYWDAERIRTNQIQTEALEAKRSTMSESDYEKFCRDFGDSYIHAFERGNPLARDYDAWYSDGYFNDPLFLYDKYVPPEPDLTYILDKEERDGAYTIAYYYIDHKLVEAVTPANFEKFLEKYKGKDRNVVNFIAHFGITRKQFEKIYEHELDPTYYEMGGIHPSAPYKADYLFGSKEKQDLFFKKQPYPGLYNPEDG